MSSHWLSLAVAAQIAYGSGFFRVYAAEAERVNGEVLQPTAANTRSVANAQRCDRSELPLRDASLTAVTRH